MDDSAERFRLGVNYWPAATAMNWLRHYDPAETRRDLVRLAGAGLDTVRVFLRWEDVQPTRATIDSTVLTHVIDAADAALAAGVELIVTLFTGHMSGVNYIPSWATTADSCGPRDGGRFRVMSAGRARSSTTSLRSWYDDADIVDAQQHLATTVAGALAGHPAVWAWDLGNENSNCTVPADAPAAETWMERMTTALRTADAGCQVTIGLHMEDLEQDRIIGPAMAARWCDFVCMHGYPIYADWSDGPTDEHLVPFLALITGWLAGGAPVLFEEFGLPTVPAAGSASAMLVDETDAAAYTAAVLDELWNVGALGALLWCASDYASALHDHPPFDQAVHERTFGLWRADGSAKPAVAELAARQRRERKASPSPQPWIDIDAAEFALHPKEQLGRLYRRYRQMGLR